MAIKQQWVDKYCPDTIDGYVFSTPELKQSVEKWLREGSIPHIILHGTAGVGKSTLGKIIANMLYNKDDVKITNASVNSGIDFVRGELTDWMRRSSLSGQKLLVLEEADRMTPDAQKAMRSLIEEHQNRVRIIFTANYSEGIIPELFSRAQAVFEITKVDRAEAQVRAAEILIAEGVDLTDEVIDMIDKHLDANLPDFRSVIHSMELCTDGGVLHAPVESVVSTDGIDEWRAIWEQGNARANLERLLQITENVDSNNFEVFYRLMYNNHHNFEGGMIADAVINIAKYLDMAARTSNHRITLDACLHHLFYVGKADV